MKKIKIVLVFCVSLLLGTAVLFSDMQGAEKAKTLYIRTPGELQAFSQSVNAGSSYEGERVVLTADIDMAGIMDFVPIGEWGGEHLFKGIFDGNGHVIRNLTLIGGEDANLGLFGSLGGVVCNLTIESCVISGNACGAFCSIAGSDTAAIVNCAVRDAVIMANFTDIFGGQYGGAVENCVIDGQGEAEVLNAGLRSLWRGLDKAPMNLWREGEEGLVLSGERAQLPSRIYLKLGEAYASELLPVCEEGKDRDVFCVPGFAEEKHVEVVLEFPDGSEAVEKLTLPGSGSLCVEAYGESYEICLMESENTGAVFLNTGVEGGFAYIRENKEHMLPGTVYVLDERGELSYAGSAERIRGRGNDSWRYAPKQSFGFKLTRSGDILGMGSAKDYALLAGYRDSSLLTYQVVWDLCREVEWENALDCRMVQLYVDGEYWGLYFLTEKIEGGENRIPIKETKAASGGFVFEFALLDYTEEDYRLETERGNSFVLVSPTVPTVGQLEYCQSYLQEAEEALWSADGYNQSGRYYTEYIDLQSWAAQWLIYELLGETSTMSSVYYYKDADGTEHEKLQALFPWDVEHSFIFLDEEGTKRLDLPRSDLWNAAAGHEDFREEVRRQWEERFLPALEGLLAEAAVENAGGISSLSYYVEQLEAASDMNELRWGAEQEVAQKAEGIRHWMEITIPFLQEKLYDDNYYQR